MRYKYFRFDTRINKVRYEYKSVNHAITVIPKDDRIKKHIPFEILYFHPSVSLSSPTALPCVISPLVFFNTPPNFCVFPRSCERVAEWKENLSGMQLTAVRALQVFSRLSLSLSHSREKDGEKWTEYAYTSRKKKGKKIKARKSERKREANERKRGKKRNMFFGEDKSDTSTVAVVLIRAGWLLEIEKEYSLSHLLPPSHPRVSGARDKRKFFPAFPGIMRVDYCWQRRRLTRARRYISGLPGNGARACMRVRWLESEERAHCVRLCVVRACVCAFVHGEVSFRFRLCLSSTLPRRNIAERLIVRYREVHCCFHENKVVMENDTRLVIFFFKRSSVVFSLF